MSNSQQSVVTLATAREIELAPSTSASPEFFYPGIPEMDVKTVEYNVHCAPVDRKRLVAEVISNGKVEQYLGIVLRTEAVMNGRMAGTEGLPNTPYSATLKEFKPTSAEEADGSALIVYENGRESLYLTLLRIHTEGEEPQIVIAQRGDGNRQIIASADLATGKLEFGDRDVPELTQRAARCLAGIHQDFPVAFHVSARMDENKGLWVVFGSGGHADSPDEQRADSDHSYVMVNVDRQPDILY